MSEGHDEQMAGAFDGQAEMFEKAPVQSDPHAIGRLVQAARFPDSARLLDAGCGPGLVASAFLESGRQVFGVDLSAEMVARARVRCEFAGGRGLFRQSSIFSTDLDEVGPFDGAYSRYVLHHVLDPLAFIERQVALVRPGGVIFLSDHVADADPKLAHGHQEMERLRDKTHTLNLSSGQIVDLFARAGLIDLELGEESFDLDFDEWFDRGSPTAPKAAVREMILKAPNSRSFHATLHDDGKVAIEAIRAFVRGRKP